MQPNQDQTKQLEKPTTPKTVAVISAIILFATIVMIILGLPHQSSQDGVEGSIITAISTSSTAN